MTIKQAIEMAESMVIPGVRGLGTIGMRGASGETYSILNDETLVNSHGEEVEVASVAEEIEAVTSTCDQLGGIYI